MTSDSPIKETQLSLEPAHSRAVTRPPCVLWVLLCVPEVLFTREVWAQLTLPHSSSLAIWCLVWKEKRRFGNCPATQERVLRPVSLSPSTLPHTCAHIALSRAGTARSVLAGLDSSGVRPASLSTPSRAPSVRTCRGWFLAADLGLSWPQKAPGPEPAALGPPCLGNACPRSTCGVRLQSRPQASSGTVGQ